jgi:hypothetical protein
VIVHSTTLSTFSEEIKFITRSSFFHKEQPLSIKDLLVRKKLFIKKNKDIVINFDIPSENDLIRKYCGQMPEVSQ